MPLHNTDNAALDVTIPNTWDSGLVANLALTPTASLDGWTVTLDYAGDITNIWNARIVSRDGDRYVLEAMDYNASVAAGGTVNFGFQGSGTDHTITPVALMGDPIGEPQEPAPEPTVSINMATAQEDDGTIAFDVALSEPSDTDVTVSYRTVAGSAGADDFVPEEAQITIPAGETQATLSIALINDTTPENVENFSVELVSADGAAIDVAVAQGTILDTDSPDTPEVPPAVSVTASPVPESASGTTGSMIVDGPLSTSGTQIIDINGDAVQIRAVNWFGAEGDVRAPHGLWERPMTDMMDQMVEEGFNAIRLPFSVQNILEDQPATSVSGDPDLVGLTTLEIFDRIVEYAEDIGLKIILDAHRVTQGDGAEGIWYTDTYSEQDWIDAWETLAARYGDSSAVVGADLFNEPHLGTWGTGQSNDWAAAAEQAGNAIHDIAPDWLIVVEGIGDYNGESYWWGGQLQGVRDRPVELNADNKLVYSPHDYPASVYNQPWFNDGSNLQDVFRENWGFIVEEDIAPILLGEFGSRLETEQDQAWADAITTYLGGDFDGDGQSDLEPSEVGPSFAWWSWNPNSGDTGGILEDDWTSVRENAADALAPLLQSDGTALMFEIRLDAATQADVTLSYRTEDGSAVAGEDYVGKTGSVTIPAGQVSAFVAVEIIPDRMSEEDETLSLVVTDMAGNETRASGIIVDVDAPTTGVTVTGGQVTEADPTMDHMHEDGSTHVHDDGHRYILFEVTLDAPAEEEIVLTYATRDGTAVADTTNPDAWDYHETSGELTFAPGEQSKIVEVAVHPDTVVEETEDFTFSVDGDDLEGVLEATGLIFDNDDDSVPDPDAGGGTGDPASGQTYVVGQASIITGFDPAVDVLDLGPDSIHNQIPVDTDEGFMMQHMFDASKSTLLQGVGLGDLGPENFTPIADGHLQQDLSAALAWENGTGLVRPDTVYVRSHEEGVQEIVDFDPATDTISFFYLSVRGDGERNFAVEETAEGLRFYSPITGQSLTLRDVSFSDLDSTHFEWRANQLEDNIAGRMGLADEIEGFGYENVYSGKSVEMAGLVDRAPYHNQPEYTGTPIGDGGQTDGPDPDQPDNPVDPEPPVDPAGDGSDVLDAALVVTNDWGSGATVQLRITNEGDIQFTDGWSVEVDLDPDQISGSWNGDWRPQDDGSGIVVSDVGWNGNIGAGQSVDVGFNLNTGSLNQDALNAGAEFWFI